MSLTPGGYYGGGQYLISPAYAVNPFETVLGTLIGNDLWCILPSSIYPRQLVGLNIVGPSSATAFEVYLGSPTNKIDSTNVVATTTLKYNNPFLIPPGTQVFGIWRNAANITPVAATLSEVVGNVVAGTTCSVNTGVGTAVGDTLFCFHHDNFLNTNGELVNMTAPSGTLGTGAWTPVNNTANGAGATGGRLWTATTVASGVHTVTTNQLDGASSNAVIVARMRNISAFFSAANQGKNAGGTGGAGFPAICPDIGGGVTQQAQDTLFRLFAIGGGGGAVPAFTLPAGYTLGKENIRNLTTDQALYYQVMASGATSVGSLSTVNNNTTEDSFETFSLLVRGISSASSNTGTVTFQMTAA